MQSSILLGLFALVPCTALAQAPPDVAEILKRVSDTYRAASEYELIIDLIAPVLPDEPDLSRHMHMAFKAPDRYRVEGLFPASQSDVGVVVEDGSTIWLYFPKVNEVASLPANERNKYLDPGSLDPEFINELITGRYRDAMNFAGGAKFLRDEEIDFAGAKVDCYVVSVPVDGDSFTWWIEKKSNRILREESGRTRLTFTAVKLGEPLPDDLFKFEPPPGATRSTFTSVR